LQHALDELQAAGPLEIDHSEAADDRVHVKAQPGLVVRRCDLGTHVIGEQRCKLAGRPELTKLLERQRPGHTNGRSVPARYKGTANLLRIPEPSVLLGFLGSLNLRRDAMISATTLSVVVLDDKVAAAFIPVQAPGAALSFSFAFLDGNDGESLQCPLAIACSEPHLFT
jgi:hypothetical protein